jgi:hypothetical protein
VALKLFISKKKIETKVKEIFKYNNNNNNNNNFLK